MTRIAPQIALFALLGCAWFARVELAPSRTLPGAGPYAVLEDAPSSYRMRAIELTLAAGHAPRRDAFLGEPDERAEFPPVPFPPLVHAALALVARHTLSEAGGPRELGGVDEERLIAQAELVSPLFALLVIGAAFAAGAALAPGGRSSWAGVAAAAIVALAPTAIAGGARGMLDAAPWIELAAFGALLAAAFAWRASEIVDGTLGALLAGLCAGLALAAGFEAWPLAAALGGTFVLLALREPRERAREARRTAILFVAVAAAVFAISEPGAAWRRAAPDFSRGVNLTELAMTAGALPFAWYALWPSRRAPLHAVVLALSFLSCACALFDERFFALVHVALAASIALLVAAPPNERSAGWIVVARPGVAIAVVAGSLAAWFLAAPRDARLQPELAGGLRWLRANSASPAPFNSAHARPDWRVWTAPGLAGSVAFHARRPVDPFAGRELAAGDALLARLRDSNALYVVATPCMLRDAELTGGRAVARDSALARFALGDRARPPADWQLEWTAATRITPAGERVREGELGGPLLSIWRRVSTPPPADAGPTIR